MKIRTIIVIVSIVWRTFPVTLICVSDHTPYTIAYIDKIISLRWISTYLIALSIQYIKTRRSKINKLFTFSSSFHKLLKNEVTYPCGIVTCYIFYVEMHECFICNTLESVTNFYCRLYNTHKKNSGMKTYTIKFTVILSLTAILQAYQPVKGLIPRIASATSQIRTQKSTRLHVAYPDTEKPEFLTRVADAVEGDGIFRYHSLAAGSIGLLMLFYPNIVNLGQNPITGFEFQKWGVFFLAVSVLTLLAPSLESNSKRLIAQIYFLMCSVEVLVYLSGNTINKIYHSNST